MMWNDDPTGADWVFMVIAMTSVWVVIALVVWMAIRSAARQDARHDEDPVEVLERRLARGEIDAEEFERCRAALRPARR